jgi:hypothetical protein
MIGLSFLGFFDSLQGMPGFRRVLASTGDYSVNAYDRSNQGNYEDSTFESVSQEECDETRKQSAYCRARNVGNLCRDFGTDKKSRE